jgi:hypothetical protein
MLQIYKSPDAVVFSGNPIIFGVKDTAQLSVEYQRQCVMLVTLVSAINIPYQNITLSYKGSSWELGFGTVLPWTGSMTLSQWASACKAAILAYTSITENLYVETDGNHIYFIERIPQENIVITKTTNAVTILREVASSKFSKPTHYIGLRPLIKNTVNYEGSTGGIVSVWDFFGDGEEVESLVTIVDEDPFTLQGDLSLSVEKSINDLVKNRHTGHFSINDIYKIYDLADEFKLQFYRKLNGTVISYLESDIIRVIDAQISRQKQAEINEMEISLWQYLVNTTKFMTWASATKMIDIYHPEILYFPIKITGTYYIMVREYFSDATEASHQYTTFTANAYQVVMASAAFLNARTVVTDKTLVKYEIWLENSDRDVISEVYTYLMNYTYQAYSRWWVFKNSFGVYEVIRTTGKSKKYSDKQKSFISLALPDLYKTIDRDKLQSSLDSNFVFEVNSGPLSREEALHFDEFLNSNDVYALLNGKAVPVVVYDGKFLLTDESENINNISFIIESDSIDGESVDLSVKLPIEGDFNDDFNEGFLI